MSDVTIRCRKDGPLIVTGDVTLTDHEGNVYDTSEQENVDLCRCGATSKRPFCDGTLRLGSFGHRSPERPERIAGIVGRAGESIAIGSVFQLEHA